MRDELVNDTLQPIKLSERENKGWLSLVFNFIRGFFPFLWRTIKGIPSFIRFIFRKFITAIVWTYRETAYYLRFFLYTSRQLRIECFLALLGAIAFFGYLLVNQQINHQRALLDYYYLYFSIVTILLAINLLPREKENETLEILWSQPMSRNRLIIIQLISLTAWILILSGIVLLVVGRFSAYLEGRGMVLLCVLTTSFAVASITVLISTFCRHAIATGLVSMLVLGIHYYWLESLGPIALFYNPIPFPGMEPERDAMFNLIFNRVVLVFLVGFVLDYLFRRLKQTAEWFT